MVNPVADACCVYRLIGVRECVIIYRSILLIFSVGLNLYID